MNCVMAGVFLAVLNGVLQSTTVSTDTERPPEYVAWDIRGIKMNDPITGKKKTIMDIKIPDMFVVEPQRDDQLNLTSGARFPVSASNSHLLLTQNNPSFSNNLSSKCVRNHDISISAGMDGGNRCEGRSRATQ